MLAEQVLTTPAPDPNAGMYLDLLRRTITREVVDDPGRVFAPRGGRLRSRLARAVVALLAERKLTVVRQTHHTLEERLEGWGWPGQAESMSGSRRLEFLQRVIYVLEKDGIRGDFFEGGCWRGGAVILMLGALRALGIDDRKVWAADSFDGYPRPTDSSTAQDRLLYDERGYFAISVEEFEANVRRFELMSDALVILQGYFDRSIPSADIKELALIRIDIDGYEGVHMILEHLYPKLSPGGFVLIDDYSVAGARRAVDEHLAKHAPEAVLRPIPQRKEKSVYFRKR
ncbi:MAG: macrocin O-methyltransferase [Polyangiaceae bacterium]|nr:macrocin O-methyltransferase [Polyangiaceae bacterium]